MATAKGWEGQLGALSLVLNTITLWEHLDHPDHALDYLPRERVRGARRRRRAVSPYMRRHINFTAIAPSPPLTASRAGGRYPNAPDDD